MPPFKSDPLLPTQAILLHIDRTLGVHPLSFLCIASCCSTRWSVADGRGVPAAAELFPAGSSLSRSSPYSLRLSDRTSDTGTRGINDCEIQSLIHGPEQLTSSAISACEAERSERVPCPCCSLGSRFMPFSFLPIGTFTLLRYFVASCRPDDRSVIQDCIFPYLIVLPPV